MKGALETYFGNDPDNNSFTKVAIQTLVGIPKWLLNWMQVDPFYMEGTLQVLGIDLFVMVILFVHT